MAAVTPFTITQEHLRSQEDPPNIHFAREDNHIVDPISYDELTEDSICVKINCCNHIFLRGSLAEYLNNVNSNGLCPTCRTYIGRIESLAFPAGDGLRARVGQQIHQPRREVMSVVVHDIPFLNPRDNISFSKQLKYMVPYAATALATTALSSWTINNTLSAFPEITKISLLLGSSLVTSLLALKRRPPITTPSLITGFFMGISSSLLGITASKIHPLAGPIITGLHSALCPLTSSLSIAVSVNILNNILFNNSSIIQSFSTSFSLCAGTGFSDFINKHLSTRLNHNRFLLGSYKSIQTFSSIGIAIITTMGLSKFRIIVAKSLITAGTAFLAYNLKKGILSFR